MFCKYCGKDLSDDAVFCSGCGKRLVMEVEEKIAVEEKTENVGESKIQKIPFEISDSSFTICRYCGSKIGSNNAFCTNCGKSFFVQTVQCKNCGAENQSDVMFCGKCGQKLYPAYPEIQKVQSQFNKSVHSYTAATDGISPKSRLAALLLGIFLGFLGISNFYLGKVGRGIVQLLLFCVGVSPVGLYVYGIPVIVVSVWAFIEWIIIATGDAKDRHGLKVINWN